MPLSQTSVGADSDKLPFIHLETASVAADAQFALWQSYMQGHTVSRSAASKDGFFAEARCWQIGPMLVTPSRLDPVRIVRSERQIRLDALDHYNFFMLVEGSWEGEFGQRHVDARPGDIHVIDFAHPLATSGAATYTISVQFPRSLMDEAIVPFEMHGLALPGAAGRLAADFFLSLVGRLPEFTRSDIPSVVRSTRDVIAAALASIPRRSHAPTTAALLAAAKRHIRGDLAADLSPEALARSLGTSRSTLYRVFEALGGVETFVREQRLARAHEMLASPKERRSVTEIAFEVGFASSAHFSRAFRSRYGQTPGEARGQGALPFRELREPVEAAELERYNAWKEQLR